MFGLSTELITKGKLVTVRDSSVDVSSVSPSLETTCEWCSLRTQRKYIPKFVFVACVNYMFFVLLLFLHYPQSKRV